MAFSEIPGVKDQRTRSDWPICLMLLLLGLGYALPVPPVWAPGWRSPEIANLLSAVEVTVERIVVTSLSNEVFYARILAQVDGRRLEIDSRPSDAIAVAVRVGAGIFVADEVLDKAGVLPEADKDGELTETDPESEERLAKIRDWVNTLNLPDLGTGASES